MAVTSVVRNGLLFLSITGDLDMDSADGFRTIIEGELERTGLGHLVLDMSDVSFIDSSGLGVILGRYRRMTELGKELSIVGLSEAAERVFELSGLKKFMQIYPSEDVLLRSIGGE